ncbi:MAG: outer-membrane lipoprotein carrier protein LolA [Pseudomonadota bacterium]|nr:outer-membrane lipoprotein carrier protein LolA [Pseudomonadota bacterium]
MLYYFILYISLFFSFCLSSEIKTIDSLLGSNNFFSGSFIQRTVYQEKERTVKGTIFANRKGMFRLVYEEPLNELLISDGINLYRYDKDLEQVQIQSLKELPKEIPINLLTLTPNKLNQFFSVDSCKTIRDKTDCRLYSIEEESYIKEIEMGTTNNLLRFLRYEDILGQIVSFQFTNISNKKLDKNLFTFSSPPGFDIIHYESYKD